MSTRSMILIERSENEYLGVYCHCDGYLTHNGAILIDHYSDREKVEKLIGLGDLSYLAPKVDPDPDRIHSFNNPQRGICIFYGRDRGEENTSANVYPLASVSEDPWIEYTYIYTLENEWKYFEHRGFEEGLKYVSADLKKIFDDWGIDRPEGIYGWYTQRDIKELKGRQSQQLEDEKDSKKVDFAQN